MWNFWDVRLSVCQWLTLSRELSKVQVDFKDIILQDNEEDGTLTGDVRFILYKGDHYHLTVSSDWGEDIFVDTNDVWDNGDHVGISIFPESIKITQIVES
jgi:TOBE domain.